MGVYIDKLYKLLVVQLKRGFCFSCTDEKTDDCNNCKSNAESVALKFVEYLPQIRSMLAKDVHTMYLYDPAAKGYGEIIFAYPAIKAITHYRVANKLHTLGVPIIPRIITEM